MPHRAQQRLQPTDPSPEQQAGESHLPGRLRELLGARLEREVYLSTEEAAQLTGRPSRKAFIVWARRAGIPLRRPDGGRVLSVKRSDLEWALRERGQVQGVHERSASAIRLASKGR